MNIDTILLVFELIWDFIHVYFICKFQNYLLKTDRLINDKVILAIMGANSKIDDMICSGFENVWEFIHFYLICKF